MISVFEAGRCMKLKARFSRLTLIPYATAVYAYRKGTAVNYGVARVKRYRTFNATLRAVTTLGRRTYWHWYYCNI